MLKLSAKHILFYRKQSLYVFLSLFLTTVILTAIQTIFATDRKIDLETNRAIYGDYHYSYHGVSMSEIVRAGEMAEAYHIEELSWWRMGETCETPTVLMLVSADARCQEMTASGLIQGRYPRESGEIALEEWVLTYFDNPAVGDAVTVGNRAFTLTGILEDRMSSKNQGIKMGFVSDADVSGDNYQLFLKFDETRDVARECEAFSEAFGMEEALRWNYNLLEKLNYGYTETGEGRRFVEWIAGSGIANMLGSIVITLFAMIIVYSVFRISVQQRIREYGKLLAFGLDLGKIGLLLGGELFLLLAAAFPFGAALGVLLVKGVYFYYGSRGTMAFSPEYFQVNGADILRNAGLLLAGILVITALVLAQLRRMPVIEIIKGTGKKSAVTDKRWSRRTDAMMLFVMFQYLRSRKGRVLVMTGMLALGGAAFLTGSYIEGQIARNNTLVQRSDTNTNGDIQLKQEELSLEGEITPAMAEKIAALPQVRLAEPVYSYLGGIFLDYDRLNPLWSDYWKNVDKYSSRNVELFGGIQTDEGGRWLIKTELYGYDAAMLADLEEYLLEGSLSAAGQENTVILQTCMDGVGNYDGIDLHPGDEITVRYPRENPGVITEANAGVLKMNPEGEWKDAYEERTFTIGAVVKRGLAKNDSYISDGAPALLFPKEQFAELFDVEKYSMLSVQLSDRGGSRETMGEIQDTIRGTDNIGIFDYTREIIRREELLAQKMLLVNVIVALLLLIGFFNILSSVNYILLEREREFAIVRAIGITDFRLMKTMLAEGMLHGIAVSAVMTLLTLLLQPAVKYVLDHGFLFINAQYAVRWDQIAVMALLNILLSMVAVLFPAKRVLVGDIKEKLA